MTGKLNTKLRQGWVRKLLPLQNNRCCYCERQVSRKVPPTDRRKATLEHLIRIDDGGDNSPSNLAVACRACNQFRGQVDWLTYKSWIEEIGVPTGAAS